MGIYSTGLDRRDSSRTTGQAGQAGLSPFPAHNFSFAALCSRACCVRVDPAGAARPAALRRTRRTGRGGAGSTHSGGSRAAPRERGTEWNRSSAMRSRGK